MSVFSGIYNHCDAPVDEMLLQAFAIAAEQHGPDASRTYVAGRVGMNFRAFHTTSQSRQESQPLLSLRGDVIMWDGWLDNRDEIRSLVRSYTPSRQSDVVLVAAAFEKLGTECFEKFRGDWAISIWQESEQQLILAKDYAGAKHLYYWSTPEKTVWSSELAHIVLLAKTRLTINDEYVAGYLGFYPAAELTPYKEIKSVPPAAFVVVRDGQTSVHKYWRPTPEARITYSADSEYEEHFRQVFCQAVRRRLGTDSPILCELSGGFDSTSIVCMADEVIANGEAETPRLDTFSCFDDTEPTCDERPYFFAVEEQRGQRGWHVNTSDYPTVTYVDQCLFSPVPGYFQRNIEADRAKASIMSLNGHRVVLSGIGGDELLGGIQDPFPLLADDLTCFRVLGFARNLHRWSLARKMPYVQLLFKTLPFILPRLIHGRWTSLLKIPPWIERSYAPKLRREMRRMEQGERCGRWLPSKRAYLQGLYSLMQQLAIAQPSWVGCYETRYPYLDQDLVEFLLAIPPQQIQKPGERRWLMRRALAKLLPQAVLSRTVKARGIRRWMKGVQAHWRESAHIYENTLSATFGYIDEAQFGEAIVAFADGRPAFMMQLLRVISLEHWLRDLRDRGLTLEKSSTRTGNSSSFAHGPARSERLLHPRHSSAR